MLKRREEMRHTYTYTNLTLPNLTYGFGESVQHTKLIWEIIIKNCFDIRLTPFSKYNNKLVHLMQKIPKRK